MNRAERNISKHVHQIRLELQDPLTPRRTFDALRRRLLARLDRIDALLTDPGEEPALHDEVEETAAEG